MVFVHPSPLAALGQKLFAAAACAQYCTGLLHVAQEQVKKTLTLTSALSSPSLLLLAGRLVEILQRFPSAAGLPDSDGYATYPGLRLVIQALLVELSLPSCARIFPFLKKHFLNERLDQNQEGAFQDPLSGLQHFVLASYFLQKNYSSWSYFSLEILLEGRSCP
jgi:hypothetical protein